MAEQPTVLVTGAARRIGRFIALAYARRGWHVAMHYRTDGDEVGKTAQEIEQAGGSATPIQADLEERYGVQSLIEAMEGVASWQSLVNSAAIFERDRTESLTDESWDRHQAINLFAPTKLSQAFAAQVSNQANEQANNLIVNIIDSKMHRPNQHFISYSASKASLWYLTQAMALDLAPSIRVNAIGPGPTLVAPGHTQEAFERSVETLPLARAPSEAEFDSAIGFMLEARSFTGQMLSLDGGAHLGWVPHGRAMKLPS
ncbi:MAG: SDR family NAD(P)-dependent oxidoreductase [Alphaproteobacteria bacterium]|nr:SDR family NAD(P)-dependent oxidoreductase [Alphaproteobacteria bacterium SS10]